MVEIYLEKKEKEVKNQEGMVRNMMGRDGRKRHRTGRIWTE